MAELDTLALPLLPLTTGVVLPGMVVTLTLESAEARAAVDAAAGDVDRLLVLVPRLDGGRGVIGRLWGQPPLGSNGRPPKGASVKVERRAVEVSGG